jgi:hypothetical protein
MKKVTIKDLLNKVLNFNLYTLKQHIRSALYIGSFILVACSLVYVGLYIKAEYDIKKIKKLEIEYLISAKKYYKRSADCFNNLKNTELTREDLKFYTTYESCIKGKELSAQTLTVHKASWSDPFARVTNYLRSSYYNLGPKPKRCTYNGGNMIVCNNGSSYLVNN